MSEPGHRARRTIFFLATAFLLLSSQNPSPAQHITGDLQFRVVDSLGQPVSGVNAIVTGPQVQGARGGVSDDLGYIYILALLPGSVSVRVSHSAYQPVIYEDVMIRLGKTTSLGEVGLHARLHELPDLVISNRSTFLDPRTTSSGGNIRASDFESLPVERNYRSIVSLLPQANISYFGDEVNVAGATGSENKYFVDGVDVTDPQKGITGTNLPYSFVKEIEVREGGYEAEYPSVLGGIVNVITPSGGNEFHGSASGFFTSNRFTANKRAGLLDPMQGGFSNYDVGLGVGGPLVHDELWFYAAYNTKVEQRDVAVPSFGDDVDKTIRNAFAGKLSWRASDRLQLVATITGDPSTRDAVGDVGVPPFTLKNPDPFLTHQMTGGINLSLKGTYIQSDALLFDASLSSVTQRQANEPSTARGTNEFLFVDNATRTWSGGVRFRRNVLLNVNSLHASATLLAGSHQLKAGLEYKDKAVDATADDHVLFRFSDSSYFERHFNQVGARVHNRIPSAFIQDSWQMFRDLSFHIGVRFDAQFLVGTSGNVDQKIMGPLQPRVGFVFLPGNEGSQKIFGSFGRYMQELSTLFPLLNCTDVGYLYGISYDHDPRVNPSGGKIDGQNYRIEPAIDGLRAQFHDDFSLGYERLIEKHVRVSVIGDYRTLRDAIENMYVTAEARNKSGNPGRGEFFAYPRPQRDYVAMTITVEHRDDETFNFLASYVLSRNYGNYGGLFDAVFHSDLPNITSAFDNLNTAWENTTGLLPNDRTHVFKLSGSYRFPGGLVGGITFIAASGTPLSDYVISTEGVKYVSPRGGSGRTPAIWDLNARVVYAVPFLGFWHVRLLLDLFHIASQREPVDVSQVRGRMDTNGSFCPDMTYGQAYRYQPPMSVRLGMEVSF